MSLATPCNPCCSTPPTLVNIPGTPGSAGPQGPTGPIGPTGPAGSPVVLVTASSYNASGTHVLANASTAQAAGPIFDGTSLPSVTLPTAGKNYMLTARARIDGTALQVTTQTITVYLFSITAGSIVSNSQAVVQFIPNGNTLTGTYFIINIPTATPELTL